MLRHGNGLVDLSKKAVCTTCKIEKLNTEFKFYKNRVNPITGLCLYANKKCRGCSKDYMIHKKKSVISGNNLRAALVKFCDNSNQYDKLTQKIKCNF